MFQIHSSLLLSIRPCRHRYFTSVSRLYKAAKQPIVNLVYNVCYTIHGGVFRGETATRRRRVAAVKRSATSRSTRRGSCDRLSMDGRREVERARRPAVRPGRRWRCIVNEGRPAPIERHVAKGDAFNAAAAAAAAAAGAGQ